MLRRAGARRTISSRGLQEFRLLSGHPAVLQKFWSARKLSFFESRGGMLRARPTDITTVVMSGTWSTNTGKSHRQVVALIGTDKGAPVEEWRPRGSRISYTNRDRAQAHLATEHEPRALVTSPMPPCPLRRRDLRLRWRLDRFRAALSRRHQCGLAREGRVLDALTAAKYSGLRYPEMLAELIPLLGLWRRHCSVASLAHRGGASLRRSA